jgi:HK97 gp10 family phage protein
MSSDGEGFENYKHVDGALTDIATKLRRKRVDIAMKVAKSVQNKAVELAPLGKTGKLRKSIVAKAFKTEGPAQAFVAIDSRVAPHGHLIELGTKYIKPRRFLQKAGEQSRGTAEQIGRQMMDGFADNANKLLKGKATADG